MEPIVVNVQRTNQKVHFEAVSEWNPSISIPFDYTPPIGDGEGFAGLEMLLVSFSGCVSTAIVFLLGRMGKHISSYNARAEGIRREQPLSLAEIRFHIAVRSADATEADIEAALKQAEMISPVWIALKGNVSVEMTYALNAE